MRTFSILHLSDLHFTGGGEDDALVLLAAINSAVTQIDKPIIGVITGDLVENPRPKALNHAHSFVTALHSTGAFEHLVVIPGNHDVKQFFGSFSRTERFNQVFDKSRRVLMREAGLHLIGVDSTSAAFAKGAVTQIEYDKLVRDYYEAERDAAPDFERSGLLRVVAVHHHPLPLSDGEGQRILGTMNDEGLMYLESPARFLQACMDCNVSLILHGHRHVQGLVRYSVPSPAPLTSNNYLGTSDDESWKTLYVLSCPSSTGKGAKAGFNLLEFEISSEGAFVDVSRFARTNNQGTYKRIDSARPDSKMRLVFSRQVVRDVAVDVEAALSVLPRDVPEQQLFELVSRLFRRRAFMAFPERNWDQLLYATMKTRLVWQDSIISRLRPARRTMANDVLGLLIQLEEFVAFSVLEMDQTEPDRIKHLINDKTTFLLRVPNFPLPYQEAARLEKIRGRLLDQLRAALDKAGIATVKFGDAGSGKVE